jgi:hypothetical protein
MDNLPTPAPAPVDAKARALRTFLQGLVFDAATALGVSLLWVTHDIQWTRTYWLGAGLMVGKSVVTAGLSYLARFLAPPSTT